MDNNTFRQAIELYFLDKKSCEEKYGDISLWNVSQVTDMSYAFANREDFNVLLHWNTINVKNMKRMFYGCSSFNSSLCNLNFANVENADGMLENCVSYNQTLFGNFLKLKTAENMFESCSNLNNEIIIEAPNLINANFMFSDCNNMKSRIVIKAYKHLTANYMFYNCSSLNILPKINSFLLNMNFMFANCCNLKSTIDYKFILTVNLVSTFDNCSANYESFLNQVKVAKSTFLDFYRDKIAEKTPFTNENMMHDLELVLQIIDSLREIKLFY